MADDEDDKDSAWGPFWFMVACIGIGALMQSQFRQLNSGEVESVRVWWVAALLYKKLGAGVTVWIFYGLGGIGAVIWLKKLFS